MDAALGQIQTHDCVEFKVNKAGDVLVIEKKDSFFEHRVRIGFRLRDGALGKTRSPKRRNFNEHLYQILVNHKVPPLTALYAAGELPLVFVSDLCREATYRYPKLREKSRWLTFCLQKALDLPEDALKKALKKSLKEIPEEAVEEAFKEAKKAKKKKPPWQHQRRHQQQHQRQHQWRPPQQKNQTKKSPYKFHQNSQRRGPISIKDAIAAFPATQKLNHGSYNI